MWASLVELVRATIFAGAHVLGGSLGASIVVVATLVRLALLPLMLRTARHARAQQAKLAELRPLLDGLTARFQSDPTRLWAETQKVYRRNGIEIFGGGTLVSGLVQLPLIGALFSAVRNGLGARVRFLWIADLSRGDALLTVVIASLAGVTAALAPAPATQSMQRLMIATTVGGTLLFLWSASSAVALSVGAGSAVSLLQNWLLARDAKRTRTA